MLILTCNYILVCNEEFVQNKISKFNFKWYFRYVLKTQKVTKSVSSNGANNCYDYVGSVVHESNMSTGHWWNDTDRQTRKY